MFTGLIKDVGIIESVKSNAEGKEFVIRSPKLLPEIKVDDSVATNGVCLTAAEVLADAFKVQAVRVTLEKTNLGKLRPGDKVNLELALRPMDRLGGHLVQGHVNGAGSVKAISKRGENYEIAVSAPKQLFRYIIEEGSIAVDGISLTVARLKEREFTVSIIPHTFQATAIHAKKIGDSVNIEVDMMAKYLENFIKFDKRQKEFESKIQE